MPRSSNGRTKRFQCLNRSSILLRGAMKYKVITCPHDKNYWCNCSDSTMFIVFDEKSLEESKKEIKKMYKDYTLYEYK